jgi:hypothetical protein
MLFSLQTIEPMCHLNGKESSEVSGTKIPVIKNYFRNSFCLFNAFKVRFYDFWKECPYLQKLRLHAFYSSFYHMSMSGAKETSGREFLSDELLFRLASGQELPNISIISRNSSRPDVFQRRL